MQSPIFGSSYVSRSTNLADNILVNNFPDIVETKQGKAIGALYGTPGLDLVATVGTGPIYAAAATLGQLFVVSGTELFSLDMGWTATDLGAIPTAGTTTCAGYIYSPSAGLSTVVLPYSGRGLTNVSMTAIGGTMPQIGIFTALTATQQDGFGLINQPGTYQFWQSNLLDLTTWPALNFAQASGDPDNIVVVRQKNRQVFVIKQYDTEIWQNVGTNGFAFQREDGVFAEVGIAAVDSIAKVGESFIWLAQNRQGQAAVVEMEAYQPKKISTFAQEVLFQSFPTISDARAYSYQRQGHTFYVLTFPTANQTWVYDVTVSTLVGAPMWHQWASFAGGAFSRHWSNTGVFFNGFNLVGDYRNGNIYALNPNTLTDNGTPIKRVRSWRALPKPTDEPTRFTNLRIDMQTGLQVSGNPQLTLDWSDDGGHVFSAERYQAVGLTGQTAKRVQFKRLGSTRRNSGLDRIFRISTTDQFPWAVVGAELT